MYIPLAAIIVCLFVFPVDLIIKIALVIAAVYFWYITIPITVLLFLIWFTCLVFVYISDEISKHESILKPFSLLMEKWDRFYNCILSIDDKMYKKLNIDGSGDTKNFLYGCAKGGVAAIILFLIMVLFSILSGITLSVLYSI